MLQKKKKAIHYLRKISAVAVKAAVVIIALYIVCCQAYEAGCKHTIMTAEPENPGVIVFDGEAHYYE